MSTVDAEYEKGVYSTLERIFYLFIIPVVFSLLLTIGLLYIFGVNVKEAALHVGNKIPIVQNWLPDQVTPPVIDDDDLDSDERLAQEEEIRDLEIRIASEIAKNDEQQQLIDQLEAIIKDMEIQLAELTYSDEQYEQGIQQLATVYAEMSPTRAANIIQNLTLHEQVLLLNEMTLTDRTKILEKMNPVAAAEASIMLKDIVLTKDVQIAALQERLLLHQGDDEVQTPHLSTEELALTLASMTTQQAATVLLEMLDNNEDKVINILRAMEVQARSRVLNEITVLSETDAAHLTAKLG